MGKIAFVTGITSQDASYLTEILLEKGYKVYGLIRRSASTNLWRIAHIEKDIEFVQGDLTDQTSLDNALRLIKPDEVYNLAAQSFVKYSFEAPISTCDITGLGVLRLLEAVKNHSPKSRVYQASSSEMFGKVQETPQNEQTRFYPRSPYGSAKAFAHHTCVNYREAFSMHISCGIMFNHESERRGLEFVTRKITNSIARIKVGLQKDIRLGNIGAYRDWGHARDYMMGAWLMLQQEVPDDYVLATGETHSVQEFLVETCKLAGLNYLDFLCGDAKFERSADVDYLRGDASKARKVLNWKPTITFKQLVSLMYESDLYQLHNNSQGKDRPEAS